MSKEVVNVQMEREFYDKVMTNVPQSGGGTEEKFGFVYLTKEAILTGMGVPTIPESVSQDEFKGMMDGLCNSLAVVATRRDGDNCDPIQVFDENCEEGRITFDRWDAVAINFDQLMFDESYYGYIPMWKGLGASIEEAKATVSQAFPNQLTEDEFFGRA